MEFETIRAIIINTRYLKKIQEQQFLNYLTILQKGLQVRKEVYFRMQ